MSDPSREDVLDKLDALMKRHQPPADADIPVLTDLVAPPAVDLDAIPLLTEEIPSEETTGEEAATMETSVEEPFPALPELEALEYEAPPAAVTAAPEPAPSLPGDEVPAHGSEPGGTALAFDIPPGARYVSLAASPEQEAAPAAPEPPPAAPVAAAAVHALSDDTIQLIADTIKADVAKILDEQLQQALAQQLQSSLHVALDRALSSMLDQFVIHIEEVVKLSIASELKKQLAELHKPEQH